MKRKFYISGDQRFTYLVLLFLLTIPTVLGWDELRGEILEAPLLGGFFFLTLLLGGVYFGLDAFINRLEADEEGLKRFDKLGRLKWAARYEDLTEYMPTRFGGWRLMASETPLEFPRMDFLEFHNVIVEHAPQALLATRWQTGQLPPSEDFESLSLFDFRRWMTRLFATSLSALPFALFGWMSFMVICSTWWIRIFYGLRFLLGRLSVTSLGTSVRLPWMKRTIEWNQVTAVFCEIRGSQRFFIATSRQGSISIPFHLAANTELMRKFFYSLPENTLCINFDGKINSGYRRRRKVGTPVALPQLDPSF